MQCYGGLNIKKKKKINPSTFMIVYRRETKKSSLTF
jgi:hypothetical protein